MLVCADPTRAADSTRANIMLNPQFAKGSGESPDDWRPEAWVNSPAAFHPHYAQPSETGALAELVVENLQPNDARWMQSISLGPGWYYLSVELRTQNVGADKTGATISVMEDGIMSPDVRGNSGWQRVGFHLQVGGHGADLDIALRLGGYGSLNTGKAWFRDARIEPVSAPSAGASPIFNLAEIRASDTHPPKGSPISFVLLFALFVGIAALGWRMAGPVDIDSRGGRG